MSQSTRCGLLWGASSQEIDCATAFVPVYVLAANAEIVSRSHSLFLRFKLSRVKQVNPAFNECALTIHFTGTTTVGAPPFRYRKLRCRSHDSPVPCKVAPPVYCCAIINSTTISDQHKFRGSAKYLKTSDLFSTEWSKRGGRYNVRVTARSRQDHGRQIIK